MTNPTEADGHEAEKDAGLAPFPLRVPEASGTARSLDRSEVLRARLEILKRDHRRLDEQITAMAEALGRSNLALQRLKREKLALKDQITRIEDELTPDIIA